MKKAKWVGLILGAAVIIIGAAIGIGNLFYRKSDPKTAVVDAVAKTLAEIHRPSDQLTALLARLYSGGFKQELTMGVDKLGGDLIPLEPAVLSVAEVLTLANVTRRNEHTDALTHELSVRFAVTPLADLYLYGDADTIAVNLPQAFDYFVTLDARHVAQEWDNSLLGTYVGPIGGMILEDPFYEYYRRLLFTKPLDGALSAATATAQSAESDATSIFIQSLGLLDEGTEYIYEGTETITGAAEESTAQQERRCDVYRVAVPEAALNAYWQAVNPVKSLAKTGFPDDLIGAWLTEMTDMVNALHFNGGLIARIFVSDGKVAKVELTARPVFNDIGWNANIAATFNGATAVLDDIALYIRLDDGRQAFVVDIPALRANLGDAAVFYSAAEVSFGMIDSAASQAEQQAAQQTAQQTAQPAQPARLSWEIRWDSGHTTGDNFTFSVNGQMSEMGRLIPSPWAESRFSLDLNGRITADYTGEHVDADIKKLALSLDIPRGTLDAVLGVTYVLTTDDSVITYNQNGAVPLTRLSELDALAMYGRVMTDPALSRLLGEVLP